MTHFSLHTFIPISVIYLIDLGYLHFYLVLIRLILICLLLTVVHIPIYSRLFFLTGFHQALHLVNLGGFTALGYARLDYSVNTLQQLLLF